MNDNIISFEVTRIVFEANDSNFKIVRCNSLDDNSSFSIKGDLENVKLYERYDAMVKDKETNRWGVTYEVSSIIPKGLSDGVSDNQQMMLFLKHYVSESVHDKCEIIYDNIYEIISQKKEKELLKVYGIGAKTMNKIFSIWDKKGKELKMVANLLAFGIDIKAIDKIRYSYNGDLESAIKDLDEDIYNLMYKNIENKIDKINAIVDSLDYDKGDIRRIKARIFKSIKDLAEIDYKSWITMVDFFNTDEIYLLINTLGVEIVQKAFELLIEERRIVRLTTDKYDICGLYNQYNLETRLIDKINELASAECKIKDVDFEKEIAIEESVCGFKFTDKQKNAIKEGVLGTFVSIVGSGGTGKTSISRAILNIIERNDSDFKLTQCALSGRAGRVLSESNGRDSRTIASILYSEDKLNSNVLMIDELSMVDLNSFLQLLEKVRYGTKIITMGDKKQLPSLSIGKMVNDLELFNSVTTIELTEIHRQALKSGILVMANDLIKDKATVTKNGKHILGELKDMYVEVDNNGMTKAIRKAIELYKKEEMFDVQMICATNSLCYQANTDVQKILGKTKGNFVESKTGIKVNGEYVKYKIYKNDKIMIIKNNYKIALADDYRKGLTNGCEKLFNGEMGLVTEVNSEDGYIFAKFDDVEYAFEENCFDNIVLGYCCTVHKTQGASAKYIVSFTNNSYVEKNMMLSNEWLYTCITRTRDACFLYSTLNEIDICVKTRATNNKNTFIEIINDNK